MRGDTLEICQEFDPEAPAPTELETVDGDHRMLVTLRRMSATEAAAIKRSSLPREAHFETLDKDEDGQLSLDEVRRVPDVVRQVLLGIARSFDGWRHDGYGT